MLSDLHHVTFLTADMDRLIGFYERVFEAHVTVDLEEEGLRHAFIEVGQHTVLHPFQVPGVDPPAPQPMFQRGRLDHFALNAASEASFLELRRRVINALAQSTFDATVRDAGIDRRAASVDPSVALRQD
jgi:catechol 2,3-dioxygenase-like lactoylglutathione lyase family enzyme